MYPDGTRIYADVDAFLAELHPPQDVALAAHLGLDAGPLVWAGQQLYTDCTLSMMERFVALDELEQRPNLSTMFLWADTDGAGSDDLIMRFRWRYHNGEEAIRVCRSNLRSREMRYVSMEPDVLQGAIDRLGKLHLPSLNRSENREQLLERFERLKAIFTDENPGTLSEFNYRMTHLLLDGCGYSPNSVLLSAIIEAGLLTPYVEAAVNQIGDLIRVFNASIEAVSAQGFDPKVRPLPDDYLPLNYACPQCNRRLKLNRHTANGDHFAAATCKCGEAYQFFLGEKSLSIDELVAAGRWSPDVMLILFMNNLTSGYLGGQSSTVYFGLVMRPVLHEILGWERIPILVPGHIPDAPESLLHTYLNGALA